MTAILGISALYHDSAAALLVDGQLVAAAQEERFTRKKHDAEMPRGAIDYCLRQAGRSPAELDYVVFYDKPLVKFERLLESALSFAPTGYRNFRLAIPHWIRQNLHVPREITRGLAELEHFEDSRPYRGRIAFLEHHESHAASAFFPSPFEEAAILTMDGVGEWHTTCIGVGRGNRIQLQRCINFPHSLGMLYSAFTHYCGFRVNSGEYKLMGLAPYGRPVFADQIRQHLIDLRDDGSFRLDMRFFDFAHGLAMTSRRFHSLFAAAPRKPESELQQRHMDLAASVQAVVEDAVLRLARQAHVETGLPNLVLAGGVALNCVANGRLLREGPFDNLWVQPAAGDAGGALGAAWFVWHQLLGQSRTPPPLDAQHGSRLGPEFTAAEIQAELDQQHAVYVETRSSQELCEAVVEAIDQQCVVGWFQGRMEFGPRALGSRSILGDARSPAMQSTMNLKIKYRESFRPFAPIVLQEHADAWFELAGHDSPYMLLVANIAEPYRGDAVDQDSNDGLAQAGQNRNRGSIPAVTHVDGSARVQTVDSERDPLLHQLLTRFHQKTGCPVMINTSFNIRSEPLVCTPSDAFRCFQMTEMDMLAIGPFVLRKQDQKQSTTPEARKAFAEQFEPD